MHHPLHPKKQDVHWINTPRIPNWSHIWFQAQLIWIVVLTVSRSTSMAPVDFGRPSRHFPEGPPLGAHVDYSHPALPEDFRARFHVRFQTMKVPFFSRLLHGIPRASKPFHLWKECHCPSWALEWLWVWLKGLFDCGSIAHMVERKTTGKTGRRVLRHCPNSGLPAVLPRLRN